jgi:hypothetical protein
LVNHFQYRTQNQLNITDAKFSNQTISWFTQNYISQLVYPEATKLSNTQIIEESQWKSKYQTLDHIHAQAHSCAPTRALCCVTSSQMIHHCMHSAVEFNLLTSMLTAVGIASEGATLCSHLTVVWRVGQFVTCARKSA